MAVTAQSNGPSFFGRIHFKTIALVWPLCTRFVVVKGCRGFHEDSLLEVSGIEIVRFREVLWIFVIDDI